MARLDTASRLLDVKLVYYGPALGGKTTNLRSLHSLLDPRGEVELMSLDTKGDRTLFFDLLPIDLGEVHGFRLLLRLFTVPGQVHYEATRRIVLRDADGVAFVADSSPGRLDANAASLLSLDKNLEAGGVAPGTVPIVLQANKRDLPDASPLEEVEHRLRLESLGKHGRAVLPGLIPGCALEREGVFETFETLLRATLATLFRKYSLGRLGVSRQDFGLALYEALTPYRPVSPDERPKTASAAAPHGAELARGRVGTGVAQAATEPEAPEPEREESSPSNPWRVDESRAEDVLPADALLEESVQHSMGLAESLGDQRALRNDLQRRVCELGAINALAQRLTATLEPDEVMAAAVEAARAALPRGAASVLVQDAEGNLRARGHAGIEKDPLLSAGHPPLASILLRSGRTAHFADIDTELVFGDASLLSRLSPFCTLAVAPFDATEDRKGLLVAYGADKDKRASPDTSRYLAAVASQVALALQNTSRHALLLAHGERLQEEVEARTEELRVAHEELVATSGIKDRILSCVNHELRTPVTKLLSAAQVLERVKPGTTPPASLLDNLANNARGLARLLDQVLSAQTLLSPERRPAEATTNCTVDLVKTLEAVAFTHQERAGARQVVVRLDVPSAPLPVSGDPASVTLILSQLVDNALKFTEQGTEVRVSARNDPDGAVRVLVTDAGPGVPPGDVERIFTEFDQGAADSLVAKPDGLGLGLAIARRLARRLGGDIRADSKPDGSGARFELRLLSPSPVAAGLA